jgi:hypothetical protein
LLLPGFLLFCTKNTKKYELFDEFNYNPLENGIFLSGYGDLALPSGNTSKLKNQG